MQGSKSTTAPRGSQALVDKYRPRILADVRGQEHVVGALQKWLGNPYSSAFIFEGGTGTGKTSAAIALARDLGVEVDQPQLGGLYQIPSGEQTGETVRALAQSLALSPMMGSGWKVAIINEADYMSPSAAQIWLDVLENLPRKTVVIFTTNHAGKLPSRFRDRCTTYHFESSFLILRPTLEEHLDDIWTTETGDPNPPRLQDLDIVDQEGNSSFRRMLQAIQPHVLAGTRPTVKPAAPPPAPRLSLIPRKEKDSLDWSLIEQAYRAGRKFTEIGREIGASWQLIMCGLKKRGVC